MASTIQASRQANAPFTPPQISHQDLIAFHDAHFSNNATHGFASDFLNSEGQAQAPQEADPPEFDEDDDGLGYYDDGVKRTLTDEQIAMFRHSELEALRRKSERQPAVSVQDGANDAEAGEIENDGGATPGGKTTSSAATGTSKKKTKGKKAARNKPYEPKPDLRKRTWDVVETGLDTLEYD